MDGQTDGETNTLASRGLEEPAHALRGLEDFFLKLCCCVSFLFWRGKKKFYLAGCAVVSVFGSGDYDFVLIQLELKLIQIR